jgi:hypothetical protein
MTQAEIEAAIVNAIDGDSLTALQEYADAANEVNTAGARQNDLDIIAKNLA